MDGMGLKIYCVVIDYWKIFSYESLLFSAKFQALSNHNIHNPSIEAQPGMFFLIIRAGLPVTSVTVQKTFHVQYIFWRCWRVWSTSYDVMIQPSAIRFRTFLRLTWRQHWRRSHALKLHRGNMARHTKREIMILHVKTKNGTFHFVYLALRGSYKIIHPLVEEQILLPCAGSKHTDTLTHHEENIMCKEATLPSLIRDAFQWYFELFFFETTLFQIDVFPVLFVADGNPILQLDIQKVAIFEKLR